MPMRSRLPEVAQLKDHLLSENRRIVPQDQFLTTSTILRLFSQIEWAFFSVAYLQENLPPSGAPAIFLSSNIKS